LPGPEIIDTLKMITISSVSEESGGNAVVAEPVLDLLNLFFYPTDAI
jgi:hypothetical protein